MEQVEKSFVLKELFDFLNSKIEDNNIKYIHYDIIF